MRTRWTGVAWVGAIAVIVGGVVLFGLLDPGPRNPQVPPPGPPQLYSSPAAEGKSAALPMPNDTNIFQWSGATPVPVPKRFVAPPQNSAPAAQQPRGTDSAVASSAGESAQTLSNQYPAYVHQVFAAVPGSGSEPGYFAALGNLINGSPIPQHAQIPPTAVSLARAQADIDRGDLRAAVDELRALPAPAARVMQPWIRAAETRLAASHHGTAANSQPNVMANAMPVEIPPYARQSTAP